MWANQTAMNFEELWKHKKKPDDNDVHMLRNKANNQISVQINSTLNC